ncbi:MAG: putative toxin-antitoxin system toxin component, PIN family [Chloroflexi bacterium]|nr:putative toxin-antitoxin system toxin component, PIN family [Chloroflexota bacterium]
MRVVLDTNIFISAILGGRLGVIIDEWRAGKFKLIITEEIAREYLDVINRPKFKIPQIEILTTTEYLLQNAEFVTPVEEILVIVADATDNKFLEAADAGNVNFIVSGDHHVLELGSFREIPILTAKEFIDLLNAL